jgi:hypothetical protein
MTTITRKAIYHCTCGAALEWAGQPVVGAVHNGTRAFSREAICPDCTDRFVARVWECTFRPRGILSERWFRVGEDGTETAIAIEKLSRPGAVRTPRR